MECMFKGINVRVIKINGSFVSLKYMSSNAKTRVKLDQFKQSIKNGVFKVINPSALPEEMRANLQMA